MIMHNYININISPSGSLHNDLHLIIKAIDFECVADTYYLLLDDNIQWTHDDYKKVNEVLIHILNKWIDKLESLKLGDQCFLPFDFSDQYIGCLCVELIDKTTLKGIYGFTRKITGIHIYPSDIESFTIEINDFESDSRAFSIDQKNLISDIHHSISMLEQNLR